MPRQMERVELLDPSMDPSTAFMQVCATLRDGTAVSIRPVRLNDEERLRNAFKALSATTVRRRFFHPKKGLTAHELHVLTEPDFIDHVSLAVTVEHDGDQRFIAVGRFVRSSHSSDRAELALTVADEYQHRGVGALLMQHIVAVAQAAGVRELEAFVLDDNQAMLALIQHTKIPMHQTSEHGIHCVILKLDEPEC